MCSAPAHVHDAKRDLDPIGCVRFANAIQHVKSRRFYLFHSQSVQSIYVKEIGALVGGVTAGTPDEGALPSAVENLLSAPAFDDSVVLLPLSSLQNIDVLLVHSNEQMCLDDQVQSM